MKRTKRKRGPVLERAALLLLASLGSTACGSDDEPPARTLENIGDVCVEAAADGRLAFSVRLDAGEHCLSSCNTNTTTCRATLTDHRIELRSLLEIRPAVEVCDAACHGSVGTCQLEAPPPGEYEFVFASRFDTATLPLAASLGLYGAPPCGSNESND